MDRAGSLRDVASISHVIAEATHDLDSNFFVIGSHVASGFVHTPIGGMTSALLQVVRNTGRLSRCEEPLVLGVGLRPVGDARA